MSLFSSSPPFVRCGLFPIHGNAEDYPLLHANVHYDLVDVQTLANLVQTYVSNASSEAEIRYVFPLPSDASVSGFKAVIDGKRTIKGVVKEKAKAKAEYDEAVSRGKTAALLQQDNVEIFQVSLGNIRPKQTIEVHISFACIIAHDGSLDTLRLTFPTAIAPRYGSAPNTILNSFGSPWERSRHSNSALMFSVAVQMTSRIKSITSPSHPIAMKFGECTIEPSAEFDPSKARVSLSSPALLDKDIVIVLSCQGLDKPRCMVEPFSPEEGSQESTDAYALTLVPRFELPALPSQEYIFLVDRSGSMGGGKIHAVRAALQIMLKSLPARDTSLNIISFGSSHSLLWPTSVTYSADSVREASLHVDAMAANFGGTEIRVALEAAFSSRSSNHTGKPIPTSVFVLTDGEAFDLDGVRSCITQAVAQAKLNNGLLRIFCMGIGNAVSKAMCEMIARVGRGTSVFVGEEEKPDQKLMSLLRAARGGIVEDLSVDWGIDDVDVAEDDHQDFEMVPSQDVSSEQPKEPPPISLFDETYVSSSEKTDLGPQTVPVKLPPPPRVQQAPLTESLPSLYPGFRTSLFAIVQRSDGGNSATSKLVRIKGSVLGRPVQLEVPVTPIMKSQASEEGRPKMLHILAARALVQSFEDEGKTALILSDVHKAEILRIAERYGIASSQTSFVAVDEDGESVDLMGTPNAASHEYAKPAPGGMFGAFGSLKLTPARNYTTAGFGSFGAAPSNASNTSLFGSLGATPSNASNTPLFGFARAARREISPSAETSAFASVQPNIFGHPTADKASLFGAAQSSQPVGSIFSKTGTSTHPQPTSPFGSTQATESPAFSAPGTSIFATPQFSGFGQSTPSGTSLFGSAESSGQTSAFGSFGAAKTAAPTFTESSVERERSRHAYEAVQGVFPNADQQRLEQSRPAAPPLSGGSFNAAPKPSGLLSNFSPQFSSFSDTEALPSTIESFARMQSFDGSFTGSTELYQLLVKQRHAPALPKIWGASNSFEETLWCTLLCVAYLEAKFVDEKDVWEVIVEKAMAWVEETLEKAVGANNAAALLPALKNEARKDIV